METSPSSNPYRIQSWEEGSKVTVLVMAQEPTIVSAWTLALDRATGEMTVGTGFFDLKAHPEAIQAPKDMIAAALKHEPAERHAYRLFGLKQPQLDAVPVLAWEIWLSVTAATPTNLGPYGDTRRMRNGAENGRLPWANRHDNPWGAGSLRVAGYAVRERTFPFATARELPAWPGGKAEGHALATGPVGDPDKVENDHVAVIAQALHEAMAPIREHFANDEVDKLLGPWNWTHTGHAFYAAPGEAGERRRQAGRLYPAFAPHIAFNKGMHARIDEGRPYEQALASFCAWARGDKKRPFPVAIVRHLRTLPPKDYLQHLVAIIRACESVPVDWLPANALDWSIFSSYVPMTQKKVSSLGLDLADLFRPYAGDWAALQKRFITPFPGQGGQSVSALLNDVGDLPNRLAETLVLPLMLSLASAEPVKGSTLLGLDIELEGEARRIAAALAYGGKTLTGVLKLSHRWHRNLTVQEAALPHDPSKAPWPALTAAFTASNGLRVVPLATDAELREEGRHLRHCVGGYTRKCRRGEAHIFSVRGPGQDGGHQGISTLEFGPAGRPAAGEPYDLQAFAVLQHRGASNASPAAEAEAAVEEFVRAVKAGVLAHDPEALVARNPTERQGYDWRDPENIRQAFAAWAPYLPRAVAKEGVEGLHERLRPVVREVIDYLVRMEAEADKEGESEAA